MSLTTRATPEPADLAGDDTPTPTRRQVLITGGVVAAAAAVTAACGSSSSTPAAAAPTTVKTADVPVGGGKILADAKVVVTQPAAGTYKAFTAVCTHQGCVVASVANGAISCACHGSVFSATDGSVTTGPASSPLAAVPVTVSGDTITLA
jgi:Rieske Fe-S protein